MKMIRLAALLAAVACAAACSDPVSSLLQPSGRAAMDGQDGQGMAGGGTRS